MFGRQSVAFLRALSRRGTVAVMAVAISSVPISSAWQHSFYYNTPITTPVGATTRLTWCEETNTAPSSELDPTNEDSAQSQPVESLESEKGERDADAPQLIISQEEFEENDEEWMQEKEKCSFCKMFIHSPCKAQFKWWSLCVDKAKDQNKDYAAVCSTYTRALMHCTSDNSEYFQALEQKNSDGDDDHNGEHAGTDSERQA